MNMSDRTVKTLYYTAISLFSAVFIASVSLNLFDPQGGFAEFRRLNFPVWVLYPQQVAKTLGIIAIFKSNSRSLKDFAFAGFLYNLLLATGAHIAAQDLFVIAPLISLVLWVFAYVMDRIYHERFLPLTPQTRWYSRSRQDSSVL